MRVFSGNLVRQFPSQLNNSIAANGVSISVYVGKTGTTLASLFNAAGAPISNPLTTDSAGYYTFSAVDGIYRLSIGFPSVPDLFVDMLDGEALRGDFDEFKTEQQQNYDDFIAVQGLIYKDPDTFTTGSELDGPNEALRRESDGEYFRRIQGPYPYTVAPDTDPTSDPLYVAVGSASLSARLAEGSATLAVPNTGPINVFYNEHVSVSRFGAIDKTGVASSTAAFQAVQLGATSIFVPQGTYKVTELNIQNGQTWYFDDVILVNEDNTKSLLRADQKSNWSILGKLELVGDLGTGGTTNTGEIGLLVNSCKNYTVQNVYAHNFRGHGIKRTRTVSPSVNYGDLGKWFNISANVNLIGFDIGELAEYDNYTNITIVENNVGLIVAGGNNNFVNGNVTNNGVGIHLKGGVNNAHGVMSGLNVNHNIDWNWLIEDVTQGQTIANCHTYANEPHTGLTGSKIGIVNSRGVNFSDCILDCKIEVDETGPESGYNYINNCYTPGGYGGLWMRNQDGGRPKSLIVRGAKGYGLINPVDGYNINDPADFYVAAERTAGTTQSLTSDTLTKLIFPTVLPNGNNRGAYDPATSSFAIPAFLRGNFELSMHLAFQGDTLTGASSFVQIFYNGSQIATLTPSAVSDVLAPKKVIYFDAKMDFYLGSNGVFEIRASITGSAILFAPAIIGRSQFTLKSLN